MDSKKYDETTHADTPLSPAEVEELRALLREVYPDPGRSIRDGVMAAIQAETNSKILKKQQKDDRSASRRHRQALFMKWGGMAACITILCGVLVIAAPLMNRSGGTLAYDASNEMVAEMAAKMAAGTETEAMQYTTAMAMDLADTVENGAGADGNSDADVEAYADEGVEAEETVSKTTQAPVTVKSAKIYAVTEADSTAADEVDREAFVLWLIDKGHITEAAYEAWLAEMGYTGTDDWQPATLCEGLGLDVTLIDTFMARLP